DRAHAHQRRAGAGAGDGRLGQRRVDHAPLAELLLEALGDLEGAAVDADVLADHEDPVVAAHLLAQTVGDGLEVRLYSHGTLTAVIVVRTAVWRARIFSERSL